MGDDTIKRNISKNITKYREASDMSQKELAKRLGVIPSRVSNWETGANCPTIDILFELCEVLGISINDIYGVYPDSKFILEYKEQEIIKKYRALDAHGKEMVDFTLSKEYERTIAMIEQKQEREFVLMAAHNDNAEDPEEQEKMRADLTNLKNMKRP